MPDLLESIREAADALTEPGMHLEPVYDTDRNRNKRMRRVFSVRLPSLLDQLHELFAPSSTPSDAESGGHSVPGSRPPVNLDAVSAHAWIGAGAARWVWSLKLDQRDNVSSNVRALVGAAGRLEDDETRAALLAELRSWQRMASVLTGWETAPFSPDVPCPIVDCGRRRLRVRYDTRTAACLGCGAGWDSDTIGVLGAYIVQATGGEAA